MWPFYMQERRKALLGVLLCNQKAMSSVPKMERKRPLAGSGPDPQVRDADYQRRLVRQAQGGDTAAYEELVRIHQPRLLAVVGGILRRNQEVEDIAQQGLVKAYVSLKRFDLRSAFGTWPCQI